MIKKLLLFFLTIFTMTAYAQNVTMTGTVVDTRQPAFNWCECGY